LRILGVDPGLVTTGYGIIEAAGTGCRVIEAGVIRTEAAEPLELRILKIYRDIKDIIAEFGPDAVSVEELYTHYAHPATATLMGHARGTIFLAAAEAGTPIVSYTPTRLKKALTGDGRAGKLRVQRAVQSLLGLSRSEQPDHVTDALAAAMCHSNVILRKDLIQQMSSR